MSEIIYSQLAARFPTEDHAKVNKGGGDQTYVPAEKVISRLNDVLGVAGWSFRVLREGENDVEAWVLGELTATIDGKTVTRQQYGNQERTVGRGEREKPVIDRFKKAGTDALKKCASLMGVALYLYDADERHEVEAEMREAARPKPGTVGARVMARAEARHIEENGAVTKSNDGPRPLPTTTDEVRAAAMVTGANPLRARWERLVAEAERVQLPTWKGAKAIDAGALSDAQLEKYADSLEGKIAAHTGAAA